MRTDNFENGYRWAQAIKRAYPFAGPGAETKLDFSQGIRLKKDALILHVTDLVVRFRVNLTAPQALVKQEAWQDRGFLHRLLGRVSLNLANNAPSDEGGPQILTSLDFRGLNVLEFMTGRPTVRVVSYGSVFTGTEFFTHPGMEADPSINAVLPYNRQATTTRRSDMIGWAHRQFFYGLSMLAPFGPDTFTLEMRLPIGYRHGENGGLNPIPTRYLTGEGCDKDCESGGPGFISWTPNGATTQDGWTVDFPDSTCDFYMEGIALPRAYRPILPYVRQNDYGTGKSGIKTLRGAQAFVAFMNDWTNGVQGADTQDNIVVECDGVTVVPQVQDERRLFLQADKINALDHDFALGEQQMQLYTDGNPQGKTRYYDPGNVLIANRGSLLKMVGSTKTGLDISVTTATAANQKNVLVQGIWAPQTAEMLAKHNKLMGTAGVEAQPETKDSSGLVIPSQAAILPQKTYVPTPQ